MTLLASWMLVVPIVFAEQAPLEIGLVPNLTTRTLLTSFEPMRAYLEHQLHQSVRLSTAPNFREFYARTLRGEFDLVITPAHFAWLAHREAGYIPVLTYVVPLSGLLIVSQESAIHRTTELHNKRIGIVDPFAIVSMQGLQTLREQGLRPGVNFSLQTIAPHDAVALAVINGDLDRCHYWFGSISHHAGSHSRAFTNIGRDGQRTECDPYA